VKWKNLFRHPKKKFCKWEQGKIEEAEVVKKEARTEAENTRKAVKNVQSKVEKATLGDPGVLADLKKKMDSGSADEAAAEEAKPE